MAMNTFVKDFIREKVCFYSPLKWADSQIELLKYSVKMGARGLEFLNCAELREPDMAAARELGRFAKANDLILPCLSVGISLVGERGRENIEKVKKYAEICSELEIPYLHHTVAPRFSNNYEQSERDAYFAEGVAATCEISDYAKALGVKTLLEDQGFIVNGVKNYGSFREAAGNCFDVLLDVGNICFVDEKAEDFLAAYPAVTRHAHIKDYIIYDKDPEGISDYRTLGGKYLANCEMGTGNVNFEKIAQELSRAGYHGYYSLEFSGCKDEEEVLRVLDRMYGWFA